MMVKRIIRNFTPAWFAVNMGTGAISILCHDFPYGSDTRPMKTLSFIVYFFNLLLFILFTIITIARYLLFPHIWSIMIRHPVQSLYLGTFPMGAATLINMSVSLVYTQFGFGGTTFLYAIWYLWWCDVAISLLCCWGMVHVMITIQDHALNKMTTVWLLPVVTLIVASATGGVLTPPILEISPPHALLTITVSALLVIIGLSLAFMMLTIYLLRLIVNGLPPGGTVLSAFLPIGPAGQGGYSLLLIGQSFKALLPLKDSNSEVLTSSATGETIHILSVCIAFALWSFAVMWILFALLGVQNVLRQTRLSFAVPFWGLIFPNGVFANLTIELAQIFDSSVFRILGAIYATATFVLWVIVTARTVMLVKNAQIFHAPCLEDVDLSRYIGGQSDNQDNSAPTVDEETRAK